MERVMTPMGEQLLLSTCVRFEVHKADNMSMVFGV
jgi:hypothetical protein